MPIGTKMSLNRVSGHGKDKKARKAWLRPILARLGRLLAGFKHPTVKRLIKRRFGAWALLAIAEATIACVFLWQMRSGTLFLISQDAYNDNMTQASFIGYIEGFGAGAQRNYRR